MNSWLEKVAHTVHEHPYGSEYDLPDSYELEFPIEVVAKEPIARMFGTNFGDFVGIDASAAFDLYCESLESANNSQMKELFKEVLSSYIPFSLVFSDEEMWIRCMTQESPTREPAHLFIQPFSNDNQNESEFFGFFGGIMEGFPNDGGRFYRPSSPDIRSLPPLVDSSDEEKWADSVVFYHTSTGDLLLLNEGKIGWYVLSKGRIAECEFGLFDFGRAFLNHRLDLGWRCMNYSPKETCFPFDAYNTTLGAQVRDSLDE